MKGFMNVILKPPTVHAGVMPKDDKLVAATGKGLPWNTKSTFAGSEHIKTHHFELTGSRAM